MNTFVFHAATLTLAALPLASVAAVAQEPFAQRFKVIDTSYEVRALCPAVTDDVRTHIARRLALLPEEALVQVTFNLDGRRIDGIEVRGSTLSARQAVRQAVHQIGCDNGTAGRQRVRFDVSYRHDVSAVTPQPVARRAEAARVGASAR